MKTIAKIAIPLAIFASLVGCSSSSDTSESTKTTASSTCLYSEDLLDKEDFFEIQSFREAARTGVLTDQMEAAGFTLEKIHTLLNTFDDAMKKLCD
jgi:hypothetical protein